MIDRDRATQIIWDRIGPQYHREAAQIAAALDALGLLVVCSDPAHEQPPINPAPTADEIATEAAANEQQLHWAGKRQRD